MSDEPPTPLPAGGEGAPCCAVDDFGDVVALCDEGERLFQAWSAADFPPDGTDHWHYLAHVYCAHLTRLEGQLRALTARLEAAERLRLFVQQVASGTCSYHLTKPPCPVRDPHRLSGPGWCWACEARDLLAAAPEAPDAP